jgi:hypothetical protein
MFMERSISTMPKEPKSEIVVPLRIVLVDPPTGRFIYVDIGRSAGQFDSAWQRRIKIPLEGITWDGIDSVLEKPKRVLQARIPGRGKDGGPSCATLRPIDGWKVVK